MTSKGECREYKIMIESYLPLQDRYSCILVGCFPSKAYQQTKDGQRVLIMASVMSEFEIINPEMLEENNAS